MRGGRISIEIFVRAMLLGRRCDYDGWRRRVKAKESGRASGLARLCKEDLLDVICGTHSSCGYLRLCIYRVCFDRIVWGRGAYGGEVENT
jgi:hypothetical protein